MIFISDANDPATVKADVDIFFSPSTGYFQDTDADEVAAITADFIHAFNTRTLPSYWGHGQKTAALIQVYDLILPLDLDRAQTLLSRLGAYANALLANRDDKTNFSREDAFRGQIMAAWGAITHNRDDKWNTDVVTSGLFVYAMAAFARRVLDRPDLYPQFIAQAIALINAVIETYEAFHPELRPLDNFAFYVLPRGYGDLTCNNGANDCSSYRDGAGRQPIAYNENLSMMKALAELALAANSNLYRASADATPLRMNRDQGRAAGDCKKCRIPRFESSPEDALADLTPYYEWDYRRATKSKIYVMPSSSLAAWR